ncbi:PREDICTED: mediator of RNA polymerase II transcription subunit 24-like [Acropora digitifera]|uniref:mediator of RNA polymerase II transcription subunit 24-like n=1 Tax=Acropora digitifera TaxID=70779 RepID=UPI00077ABD74|nr:PREDICTED: mediator of RNA polymerase II transcription subunit 24-like [Acropora digitifera]
MLFAIFHFQVLLSPSYIPEQVADVLDSVMHTQNIPRSQLYLEFLRSSFVGILEAPEKSMESVLWTGFLFLKVPAVLLILESRLQVANQLQPTPAEHSTVLNAFQQLLQFIPLLDDADIKCSCNCYREVLQQYSKSLNSQVTQKIEHLISQRIEKLSSEVKDMLENQTFASPPQQVQDAENRILEIIEALESDLSSRDEKFLNPLLTEVLSAVAVLAA